MADTIQLRRDTAANWVTANPVLADGEIGIETDTRKRKCGDGTTAWNSLPYMFSDDLDAEPTANSHKPVESGGVKAAIDVAIFNNGKGTFNISAYKEVGGVLAKFDDLAQALGTNGANVPAAVRQPGMSVCFVLNSDNKYVQYRLMNKTWSTYTDEWSFCGNDVIIDNNEFIEVKTDRNNKLLEARKIDSTKVEYGDLEVKGNIINKEFEDKIDKEEGKSLINKEFADGVESIKNPEYIAAWTAQNKMLFGIQRNGDFKFGCGVPKQIEGFVNAFGEVFWEGSHKMNIISVKKDGSGDFTSIQQAINSITDASVTKQYEVQVYDDYYINDLKELYKVHSPLVKNNTDTPSEFVAFVVTKDYVHLRGMGGMREIYVESPNINMPGYCFANIHPIFVIGNCRIENFVFKVKGGRYAIHQDLSGDRFGLDSFKTTIYKHVVAIHYGNSMYTNGTSWTSTYAQANGISNGQTQIFVDVTWDSYESTGSFYAHTNERYTLPCRTIMINCRTINRQSIKNKNISNQHFGLIDRYSCQNNQCFLFNCDIPTIDDSYNMNQGSMGDDTFTPPTKRAIKSYCLNHVIGHGNKPVLVTIRYMQVLSFTTVASGSKSDVVGGTAKNDIFRQELFNFNGEGITGTVVGGNYVVTGQYSKVHSLPYILGNCQSNPKTLVLKITDSNNVITEHTIIFDKNYMTSDGSPYSYNDTPAISQAQIIEEVNNDFGDYFTMTDVVEYINSFDDCVEDVINTGNTALYRGDAVVKDLSSGYRGWRMAIVGETPDGFAAHKIAIGGTGKVLLADKNILHATIINNWNGVIKGTMYKVGDNGKLVSTSSASEAIMIAIDNNALCKIN